MIKIFNFSNNSNVKETKLCNNRKCLKFDVSAKNICPLERDTITFTSRAKNTQKPQNNDAKPDVRSITSDSKKIKRQERTINSSLAKLIHDESEYNTVQLKRTLSKYMSPIIKRGNSECSEQRPVYELEFRTKDMNSIREKATQKFLYTKESVIKNIHDIVGARIILGNNQKGSADKVIDRLIECVEDGKLKIIEVENHLPPDKKYQYASQSKLRELARASSQKYGIMVRERISYNETGYTAVHLLVEFPNGITGEIQILGKNVAVFKELEDIPYKVLQGKSIKAEYKEIKEVLSSILPVSDDILSSENIERAKLRKEFIDYTTAAYKHERDKKFLSPSVTFPLPTFLTLYEFSKISKKTIHLDPALDFNNLYRLKTAADYKMQK